MGLKQIQPLQLKFENGASVPEHPSRLDIVEARELLDDERYEWCYTLENSDGTLQWRWMEDDFPDFNWVMFRFHVKFPGCIMFLVQNRRWADGICL